MTRPTFPSDFGDAEAEFVAALGECALFDISDRVQIEMTGRDRAKFLHNFCTNNIRDLKPGQGCEAFCVNVKGRVVGHILVYCEADSLWIDTGAGAQSVLLPHLERYIITEDVQLHDRSTELAEFLLSGALAPDRLEKLGVNVMPLAWHEHLRADIGGVEVSIRRTDTLRAPGYALSFPRTHLDSFWQQLVDVGSRPAGSTALEVARIHAGWPVYGVDISDENLAQEVGRTEKAISFTKGCYLGQEPIARLDALGHVNRELRGIKLESHGLLTHGYSIGLPAHGAHVLTADGTKEIGTITSAARLSDCDDAKALAYLRSGSNAPGTKVAVKVGEELIPAIVFWPYA